MPHQQQKELQEHAQHAEREFNAATRAIIWIAFFICVAVAVGAAFTPNSVLTLAASLGALATALIAPLFRHLGKIDDVKTLIQEGQDAAKKRSESIITNVDSLSAQVNELAEKVKASDGMPKTAEELKAFIRSENKTLVQETVAELKRQGLLPSTGPQAGQALT